MSKRFYFAIHALCLTLLAGCVNVADPSVVQLYISASARTINPGEAVQFGFDTLFDKATVRTWAWDFGDGGSSAEANPVHTYANSGAYTVSLTVTTSSGTFSNAERNIVSVRSSDEVEPLPGEERSFAGIKFIWIPAGEFIMGTENPEYNTVYTQPAHTVSISRGFWMGKYEVTQGQWTEIMGINPSYFPEPTGNRPVEQVSWDMAQEFISKLNEAGEGTFRLPTEAEWEYACRADTTTEFYFGDDLEASLPYAWTWENARFLTRLSGLLQPNPWGLYDMSGNVWEWCSDYYDSGFYSLADPLLTVDPIGPIWTPYRVARGGSWYNFAHEARSSNRFGFIPDSSYNIIGLRLCRN